MVLKRFAGIFISKIHLSMFFPEMNRGDADFFMQVFVSDFCICINGF